MSRLKRTTLAAIILVDNFAYHKIKRIKYEAFIRLNLHMICVFFIKTPIMKYLVKM